jgi:hypothetical protein
MPGTRTKRMHERYQRYQKIHFRKGVCNLCDTIKSPSLKEFKYWRIVKNLFPWDRIALVQDMIIPKRHTVYEKLTVKEKKELDRLKSGYINEKYVVIAEATHRKKSIPDHFHLHLIILK